MTTEELQKKCDALLAENASLKAEVERLCGLLKKSGDEGAGILLCQAGVTADLSRDGGVCPLCQGTGEVNPVPAAPQAEVTEERKAMLELWDEWSPGETRPGKPEVWEKIRALILAHPAPVRVSREWIKEHRVPDLRPQIPGDSKPASFVFQEFDVYDLFRELGHEVEPDKEG